jgi:menaquinone-dependent protoporphyrinogen oxidase
MKVLVAYATRHGATRGIAERIAQTLEREGLEVTLQPADKVNGSESYDAYVVGSAAYVTHWLKEATSFVRRHQPELSTHPTWLFSSGPIGTEKVDEKGRDVMLTSRPIEFNEFAESVSPRDEKIFFGAYDPDAPPIGLIEKLGSMFTRMESIRTAMPAGDFRDWPEIVGWAEGIARELKESAAASAARR